MDLDSLLSDLESSSTVEEANNALAVIIRDLGFDSGTYIDANPTIRDPAGTVARYYFTTCRTDWTGTYIAEGFVSADPVMARVPRTILPFTWSETAFPEAPAGHEAAARVMKAARDFGYTDGLVVPLHGRDRAGTPNISVTTLFWSGSPEAFEAHRRRTRHAAQLAAIHHHERMLSLLPAGSDAEASAPVPLPVPLSGREKDCLCWAARGKSSAETAIILGVSEATVNFHIQKTMRKFGVHTRLHAASRAISLGYIAP
jgi:DNA-binding CsgD family transcriptional regulator